ncbi:MAG: trypsin-like peptidase domain-containing protein [Candidatus Poribacteria bacterium]|nr:trypsin-like peptidase domain-containing protein [Candidatus Poribacteria bacterium]
MKKIYLLVVTYLLISTLSLPNVYAQDDSELDLPKGAKDRFGKGWVRDIEFSPDGNQLAVATTTGIWIYDSHTGRQINRFEGHMGGANAISYSQDGQLLAAAHQDLTIRLWKPTRKSPKKPIPALRGHKDKIYAVTFSSDDKSSLLASASADKTIRLWDPHTVTDDERLIAILPYKDSVRTVAFSFDNRMLAGGSDDGIIQVWDAGTGDRIYEFKEHTNSVQAVHFSRNRTQLVSASLDGSVLLWSLVGEGGKLHSPIQHNASVYTAKFSPDGSTFATGSADKLIRLWDTNTARHNLTFTGHKDSVSDIDFSPDGTTLVSASPDGTILLWDTIGARTRIEISEHTGGIKALAYTEDNRIRACGTGLDGKLRLWDAGTSSELSPLSEHTGLTQAVTFSNDGKTIVSGGSEDGTIFLSNVLKILENNKGINNESLQTVLTGNTHGITALALSPAGTTLATGGADGRIHLLDVASRRELKVLKGAQGTITALAFAVDGTHLFSGEENGTIRQWNALTGTEVGTGYSTPLGAITALSYSLSNECLAVGDATGTIQFFDPATKRKKAREFFIPHSSITTLIFSDDGSCLVSGSENGTIIVWDMNAELLSTGFLDNTSGEDKITPQTNTSQEHNITEQTAQEIAQNALNSTVYLEMQKADGTISQGSGFFILPNYIATNHHVVEGATKAYVKLVGKQTAYSVESIAATDAYYDLAILKLSGITAPTLSLANSDTVQTGETVYVVGNPKGLEGTFSSGIVSAVRAGGNDKLIQIDASISPGSSGGAVLNSKGKVIGVVTWSHRDSNAQNLNFVVPSNYLKTLLGKVQ